tara:strand:+ start:33 stop:188 length:156 start_codon:yes stop_codon:yes gene_type:complete
MDTVQQMNDDDNIDTRQKSLTGNKDNKTLDRHICGLQVRHDEYVLHKQEEV